MSSRSSNPTSFSTSPRTIKRRSQKIALQVDAALLERVRSLLHSEIGLIHHHSFNRANLDEARGEFESTLNSPKKRAIKTPEGIPAFYAELYMTPLLSKSEEPTLFRLMNLFKFRANVIRSSMDIENPSAHAVAEAEELLAMSTQIRERIVRANLRLVVSIARRFANDQYTIDELVSDGNVALLNAVEKFDFSRGFRFSTYATHAIQRDIYRLVRKRRSELSRCTLGISEVLTRTPVDDESPLAEVVHQQNVQIVRELMGKQLNEREQQVVSLRFGLQPGSEPATLQVVADLLQVSKERVRQIELKALEKMRRHASGISLAIAP